MRAALIDIFHFDTGGAPGAWQCGGLPLVRSLKTDEPRYLIHVIGQDACKMDYCCSVHSGLAYQRLQSRHNMGLKILQQELRGMARCFGQPYGFSKLPMLAHPNATPKEVQMPLQSYSDYG